MPKVDIGIALCLFDLTTKEDNPNAIFEQNDPKIESDAESVAS